MGTLAFLLQIALLVAGIFMMLIILLQRGRGGGLAGAFGGAGGQSAFGTKAGDVFTWITVVTATIWVLLAGIGGCAMRSAATKFESTLPDNVPGATSTEDGDEEFSTDSDESASLTTPETSVAEDGEAEVEATTEPESTESPEPSSDSSDADAAEPASTEAEEATTE